MANQHVKSGNSEIFHFHDQRPQISCFAKPSLASQVYEEAERSKKENIEMEYRNEVDSTHLEEKAKHQSFSFTFNVSQQNHGTVEPRLEAARPRAPACHAILPPLPMARSYISPLKNLISDKNFYVFWMHFRCNLEI